MKAESLVVYPRTLKKRTGVKKLRAVERIPAVIYGGKKEPKNLEVNFREIERLYKHAASEIILLDLSFDGDSSANCLALLQEIQHHPLSGKILHVDFHEVLKTDQVEIEVPIEASGEPEGVRNSGGVLEHSLQKLRVRATVEALPEILVVDVSGLRLNESLHVKDLQLPEGVTALIDPSVTVCSVALPVEEVGATTPAEGEEGAVAEPEVIREKKAEEEPADDDKKAKK